MAKRPFPHKTCGMTRHADMIAETMRRKRSPLHKALLAEGYEPDHMASSIAGTVQGLWEARQWLKWEELPPPPGKLAWGHWVPDLDAIAAWDASRRVPAPPANPIDGGGV